MTKIKLKPCPFCGGEAYVDREVVLCEDCGAQMPIHMYVFGDEPLGEFKTYKECKADMIKRWNRRDADESTKEGM